MKAVESLSTPKTEYMIHPGPCAFMLSCLCSIEPFTDPLKDAPILSFYSTDEVFAAIRTKLN